MKSRGRRIQYPCQRYCRKIEKFRAIVHYRRTLYMYIEAVGNKHFKKENQNSIDVLVFIYSAILHSWNFASTNYFVFKKKIIST